MELELMKQALGACQALGPSSRSVGTLPEDGVTSSWSSAIGKLSSALSSGLYNQLSESEKANMFDQAFLCVLRERHGITLAAEQHHRLHHEAVAAKRAAAAAAAAAPSGRRPKQLSQQLQRQLSQQLQRGRCYNDAREKTVARGLYFARAFLASVKVTTLRGYRALEHRCAAAEARAQRAQEAAWAAANEAWAAHQAQQQARAGAGHARGAEGHDGGMVDSCIWAAQPATPSMTDHRVEA